MERLDLLGFLLITFNCNVTIVGKIWLLLMVLLRMLVLVWAGAPVYQDEQERFVCNTLQPGCANVCYDAFSPVSQLRLWLLQSLAALLPSALFGVYALHRGAELAARGLAGDPSGPRALRVPDLSCGYIAHLLLRVLAEAAFGALHYLLFGVAGPERFACARPPCSGPVHCFVSRPTEKALLARLMGAASALSLLLSAADLLGSLRARARGRRAASPAPGAPRAAARAGGGGAGGGGGLEPGSGLHGPGPRQPRAQLPPDPLPGARPRKSEWVSAAEDAPARPEVRPTASALANLLAPGAITKVSGLGKASCGTEAPARVSSARPHCDLARVLDEPDPDCGVTSHARPSAGGEMTNAESAAARASGLGGGLPP
ncbi:gap junction delta-4 protein [Vulpes lagopus]|uniref:gap junction delta-4 protein n=1 Tax=Vulpes lagopus TaxID=494514 RepID=UPI001BC99FD8|nr:gap junction delta-4 protein [Vulpes lagopus]